MPRSLSKYLRGRVSMMINGLAVMIWSETETGRGAVTITVPNRRALLEDLSNRFETGQGFAVATLNLDHVVKLSRDAAFRAAYAEHTHVTADGHPVVWLSRLAGQKDVTLVPGSEMIAPLAAVAAEKGIPVALVGATEASLGLSAERLRAENPGLNIVITLAPSADFNPEGAEADAAIARLADSGARLVFLALGAPKQERFAARARAMLPAAGFVSVGAGLDFISGAQRRAPAFARALAAEWLWRLLGNPGRFAGRYGACLVALPGLTQRALASRRQRET